MAAWPVFSFNLGVYGMSAKSSMDTSAQYAGAGGVTTIAPTQVMSDTYFGQYPLPKGSEGMISTGGGSAAIFASDGQSLTQYLDPSEEGIVYADVAADVLLAAENAGYDMEPFTVPSSGLASLVVTEHRRTHHEDQIVALQDLGNVLDGCREYSAEASMTVGKGHRDAEGAIHTGAASLSARATAKSFA